MANNYGLNDSLAYIELELDSRDALSTPFVIPPLATVDDQVTETVRTTDWPLFNLARPLSNIAAIKVLEVQIPFSYYVISHENNTFVFSEQRSTLYPPISKVVTIPSGNYNATSISTALALLFTTESPYGFTYTVTYSSTNCRLTIQAVSTDPTDAPLFYLTFGSTYTGAPQGSDQYGARFILGFNEVQTSSRGSSTTPATIVAPSNLKITGPDYLYLNSTSLGSLCTIYLPSGASNLGSGSIGPQVAKIPVNVQPGGVINWQDPGT